MSCSARITRGAGPHPRQQRSSQQPGRPRPASSGNPIRPLRSHHRLISTRSLETGVHTSSAARGPRPPTSHVRLRAHAATILAVDFFHVGCAVSLARPYVAFAIEHRTRHVHPLGITGFPTAAYATQLGRELTAGLADAGSVHPSDPGPGPQVHGRVRRGLHRLRDRGGNDRATGPADETRSPSGSSARHGPDAPTGCSSPANGTHASSRPSTSSTTTPDAAIKDTDSACAPRRRTQRNPFPAPPHQIRRRQLLGGLINEHQPAL